MGGKGCRRLSNIRDGSFGMHASGSGRLARGTIIPFTYSLFNLNDHGLGEGGEEKGPSVSGMHATVKSDLEQLNGDSVQFDSLSVHQRADGVCQLLHRGLNS